jgi:hypothetical protein
MSENNRFLPVDWNGQKPPSDPTVGTMKVDETAWITPWSIRGNEIANDVRTKPKPFGTFEICIQRTKLGIKVLTRKKND